jgi:transposase
MAAIPSVEGEDVRRPSRERTNLKVERTRLINRIRPLFALYGLVAINPNTGDAQQARSAAYRGGQTAAAESARLI